MMVSLKNHLIELARNNYIDEIRFIDADDLTEVHIGNQQKFVTRQPHAIMPEAKSIIVCSAYIGAFVTNNSAEYGRMSRLVLSGYYANIMKPLEPLSNLLRTKGYRAKIMDGEDAVAHSVPLKGAAVKAGLGWIGKNSLLVSTQYGSFQALGAILTDADLGEEIPIAGNKCGGCKKCMETCPVHAIETPKVLNKEKCLSHIMDDIIADNGIPDDVSTQNYFFECDICQNACSWNQKHIKKPLETPYGNLFDKEKVERLMVLEHLSTMDKNTYDKELVPLMKGYQLTYETFKRNLEHVMKKTAIDEVIG